jgi:hypothetical protein
MSTNTNNSQNNEDILNDIQSLQQLEKDLFNSLETNTNLSSNQQKNIIQRMNQLSIMRINLYKTLDNLNNSYQNSLTSSVETLHDQTSAIKVVEKELNKSKKRLEILEEEKNNKIRLVEINDYYADKYAEHSTLMKIVTFTLIPIVILLFMNKSGFLPHNIFYTLTIIIFLIGLYFFLNRFASILMRDNMNYQEYDFSNFGNKKDTSSTTASSDPWISITGTGIEIGTGTCVGQECCSTGATYDASLNQCTLPQDSTCSSTTTESFTTQSILNNVFTKGLSNKYKSNTVFPFTLLILFKTFPFIESKTL